MRIKILVWAGWEEMLAGRIGFELNSEKKSSRRTRRRRTTMSKYVREVTEKDFDQIVSQSKTPVLVDFWAEWCGPCRMLAPIVELVAEHYAGAAEVFKLNVDDSPAVTRRYSIQGIPTLILFEDGVETERIVGVVNQQKTSSALDRYISAGSKLESPKHEVERSTV
jgi:thioredoxin 1